MHAAGVEGGTKALSMRTRLGVGRPAVEKLASPQQAPGRLHEEAWAGLLQKQGPRISQEVEIVPGCAVTVACPSCLDNSSVSPGPGRVFRDMLAGQSWRKQQGLGYGVSGEPSKEENLFSSLVAAGDWIEQGSHHTAWSVPCDSSCTCSYAYGQGPAVGPHTGQRCWPLLAGLWRAIAPLMKPWCAEGEVPTAANVNLYRGWNSCVGWHRDDEPLFGECGDVKLIVSVSFGSSAVFRWRRQSCPDDEGHLCWLGHGDILVMDGQCQDRTDPGREQERINVTFRCVKQHVSSCPLFRTGVACCLPTCAKGSSVSAMGNVSSGIFWVLWFLLGVLCIWRVLVFLGSLVVHKSCASCCPRVRSEWSRLRSEGLATIWAPACQGSSHVGNAGVGVLGMRGGPLAPPTFATAQFKRFFDCGQAVRCMVPLGSGRFMHLVVLYGYQEADTDAEQLALTGRLFDAAFGELSVVAGGQPCLLVGDFNVEPTKIPCLAKGISAGLWVDLEEAWALAAGLRPAPTCKRDWGATGVIVGISWLVAFLLLLLFFPVRFRLIGGLLLTLRFGLFLTVAGDLSSYSACATHSPLACLLVACH